MKIQKKNRMGRVGVGSGLGLWVRVDVNEELKFLSKFKKIGGLRSGVRGSGGGQVGRGFRVVVHAMLGVGGDVGYGGCEPRIEGITVKNQQNKFKYAPRIEPNNYKYVSYFRPVAM